MPTTKPDQIVIGVRFEGQIGADDVRSDSTIRAAIYLDPQAPRFATQNLRNGPLNPGDIFIGTLDVPAGIRGRDIRSVELYYYNPSNPSSYDNWNLRSCKVYFHYGDGTSELIGNYAGAGQDPLHRFERRYPSWSVDV